MWGRMPACVRAVTPPAQREWPATSEGKCCLRHRMNQPQVGIELSLRSHNSGPRGRVCLEISSNNGKPYRGHQGTHIIGQLSSSPRKTDQPCGQVRKKKSPQEGAQQSDALSPCDSPAVTSCQARQVHRGA